MTNSFRVNLFLVVRHFGPRCWLAESTFSLCSDPKRRSVRLFAQHAKKKEFRRRR